MYVFIDVITSNGRFCGCYLFIANRYNTVLSLSDQTSTARLPVALRPSPLVIGSSSSLFNVLVVLAAWLASLMLFFLLAETSSFRRFTSCAHGLEGNDILVCRTWTELHVTAICWYVTRVRCCTAVDWSVSGWDSWKTCILFIMCTVLNSYSLVSTIIDFFRVIWATNKAHNLNTRHVDLWVHRLRVKGCLTKTYLLMVMMHRHRLSDEILERAAWR